MGKLGSLLLNYGIAQKRTRTTHVFGGHLPTANGRIDERNGLNNSYFRIARDSPKARD